MADTDATLALIGLPVTVGFLVSFMIVGRRARRMVRRHLDALIAQPPQKFPETLQIGTARPARSVGTWIAVLIAAAVGMPFMPGHTWVVPEILSLLTLAMVAHAGPSTLSIASAYLDGAGIRLPVHGIHLPWSSVGAINVASANQVAIEVTGAATTSGDQPRRWTNRAVTRNGPGTHILVTTNRPELVVWVASRYLDAPALLPPRS